MMKLSYFAVRGRVEPARLILELTGTPYEFEGISVSDWHSGAPKERMAARTPFGQMPLLEDGGFTLCQSQAILRHLARKLDLAGGTPELQARADEVGETAADLLSELGRLFWDPAFTATRAAHRASVEKRLRGLDAHFARTRADHHHWVIAGRATYADAAMAYALESLMPLHPGLLETFPALESSMRAFFAQPGVHAYVTSDRRPRTWTVHLAQFGGTPEETHHFMQ